MMNFETQAMTRAGLDGGFVGHLIQEHRQVPVGRLERLWDYYRNDMSDQAGLGDRVGRAYRLAQEQGLPARLGGTTDPASPVVGPGHGGPKREVVVENDIAWRINTLVDFMFGKPAVLQSCAADQQQAAVIERFLNEVFEANGGVSFFQDLALLGAVHGHVDVLLRVDPSAVHGVDRSGDEDDEASVTASNVMEQARRFVLEIVEAPRAVPVLDPEDYRRIQAYILHYPQALNEVEEMGFLSRLQRGVLGSTVAASQQAVVQCTQIWTDRVVQTYRQQGEKQVLVDEGVNRLGRLPVVHIQNLPQPYFYEGLSEVEPLIPLQDELNTRLSDRANRVTFQSFKMYLGKGIEKFTERPIGPGQMWETDNPDAQILEFGGDSSNPSEDAHINEIREAMDKTSSVTPLAAGLVRNKIGNLTSENALRVTLMGVLARTDKKRVTYGKGIVRISELVLHAADVLGVLPNRPEERKIRLDWPSPLPENDAQRLRDAKMKIELGVPREQVLRELGYGQCA